MDTIKINDSLLFVIAENIDESVYKIANQISNSIPFDVDYSIDKKNDFIVLSFNYQDKNIQTILVDKLKYSEIKDIVRFAATEYNPETRTEEESASDKKLFDELKQAHIDALQQVDEVKADIEKFMSDNDRILKASEEGQVQLMDWVVSLAKAAQKRGKLPSKIPVGIKKETVDAGGEEFTTPSGKGSATEQHQKDKIKFKGEDIPQDAFRGAIYKEIAEYIDSEGLEPAYKKIVELRRAIDNSKRNILSVRSLYNKNKLEYMMYLLGNASKIWKKWFVSGIGLSKYPLEKIYNDLNNSLMKEEFSISTKEDLSKITENLARHAVEGGTSLKLMKPLLGYVKRLQIPSSSDDLATTLQKQKEEDEREKTEEELAQEEKQKKERREEETGIIEKEKPTRDPNSPLQWWEKGYEAPEKKPLKWYEEGYTEQRAETAKKKREEEQAKKQEEEQAKKQEEKKLKEKELGTISEEEVPEFTFLEDEPKFLTKEEHEQNVTDEAKRMEEYWKKKQQEELPF